MKREEEQKLKETLRELVKAQDKLRNTQGYTRDLEMLNVLKELVEEQTPYENNHHTASQIR